VSGSGDNTPESGTHDWFASQRVYRSLGSSSRIAILGGWSTDCVSRQHGNVHVLVYRFSSQVQEVLEDLNLGYGLHFLAQIDC